MASETAVSDTYAGAPTGARRAPGGRPDAAANRVSLSKMLTDTWLLAERRIVQTWRNPLWLAVSFMTPVLYLALFTPLLKGISAGHPSTGQVLGVFLPGILAFLAFVNGSSMGFATIFELQSGLVERLRVTPASRLAILVGPIIAGLVGMYFFDVIVVLVGWAFGYHLHWGGLLVLVVLTALLMTMFAAFSIAVALLAKEISSFAALINGINLPILLLAGVLLPISYGPTWLRVLAHFNPLYYLTEAARTLGAGAVSTSQVGLAFAVLVPLTALSLWWATGVIKKAVS
jgi:ABC-2 type transport system permease protein